MRGSPLGMRPPEPYRAVRRPLGPKNCTSPQFPMGKGDVSSSTTPQFVRIGKSAATEEQHRCSHGQTGIVISRSDQDGTLSVMLPDLGVVSIEQDDVLPDTIMARVTSQILKGLPVTESSKECRDYGPQYIGRDRSYVDHTIGAPFHGCW